jgi:dTDP-4-amino-4,6-dideoxygalactose transaminase
MWRIKLFKLNYDDQELQALKEVFDSAWLPMGQKTLDFEAAFAVCMLSTLFNLIYFLIYVIHS